MFKFRRLLRDNQCNAMQWMNGEERDTFDRPENANQSVRRESFSPFLTSDTRNV